MSSQNGEKRDIAADREKFGNLCAYSQWLYDPLWRAMVFCKKALPHYLDRCQEAEAERDYLLRRSMEAGSCRFDDTEREVGRSSNAMVYHAFGGPEPSRDSYPCDPSDLAACYRARNNAPPHLWPKMDALLPKYEVAVIERYPDAVRLVIEATGGLKEAVKSHA